MATQSEPKLPRMSARTGRAALMCAFALAAGCQTMTGPTAAPPVSPTQLLDAARLELPADCAVPPGHTYRMSYVVGTDGRSSGASEITPADGPACLKDALTGWVATFRYAPPVQPEQVTTDWMLVSARRGS